MKNILYLAWRYLAFHKVQASLLMVCLTITFFLPASVHVLVGYYHRKLTARADVTPLVVGAQGSRYDLVLDALYLRARRVAPIAYGEVDRILESGLGEAIPLHTQFTACGYPLVGTTLDYFPFRGLRLREGTLPQILGDAVLGSHVAAKLSLGVGDHILSDQQDLYDLSASYPLKMRVTGVLDDQQSPDDDGVFVDVKTAWIVAGIGHGHSDLTRQADGASNGTVVADASLRTFVEVTPENLSSFHFHGDPAEFPLSAILVRPASAKAATLLKGRYAVSKTAQILIPSQVIQELMGMVLQIERFLDANFVLVGFSTLLFLVLVVSLSLRVREREIATLHRIGCSRWTVFLLQTGQLGMVALASLALCGILVAIAIQVVPLWVNLH